MVLRGRVKSKIAFESLKKKIKPRRGVVLCFLGKEIGNQAKNVKNFV